MSKFERIVPDKRCANFLPAVEKERQQCARVARRMRTPEGFRSPVGESIGLLNGPLGNSGGGSTSCKTTKF
jgi:hypothetical protein